MISALEEFREVIANLPTGPVAAGPVTHPRISVYAATSVQGGHCSGAAEGKSSFY